MRIKRTVLCRLLSVHMLVVASEVQSHTYRVRCETTPSSSSFPSLHNRSHGAELALWTLLARRACPVAALPLLLGRLPPPLLLADQILDILPLPLQPLPFHLHQLLFRHVRALRYGRREAARARDAPDIVVQIGREELIVGKVGSRALLVVVAGEAGPPRPRREGAGCVRIVAVRAPRGNVYWGGCAHGAVGAVRAVHCGVAVIPILFCVLESVRCRESCAPPSE